MTIHSLTAVMFRSHSKLYTQKELGKWYFHKTGKGYKGGTYKGVDLAFGQHGSHAGCLLRAIEPLDGMFNLLTYR